MDGEDDRQAPEAGGHAELPVEGGRAEHEHGQAEGVDDDGQRAGPEQRVEGVARGLLAAVGDGELFVVARHELHAVRGGARGDQEGDGHGQRLEVVAEPCHEAQAPDRGQRDAQQRQRDAVEAAEVDDQQQRQQGQRGEHDRDDLVEVGVDVAGEHRVAGDVDLVAGLLELVAHVLQRREGLGVVDVAFVELGLHQRGLEVGRDEQAVDARVGDDVLAQLLELLGAARGLGRVVVGLGGEVAVGGEVDLARGAVGEAGDEVVVDAGEVVDALGGLVDEREGAVVEDGALLDFDGHDDHVGAAEVLLDAVVGLDVGVLLRQQVAEVGVDLERGQLGGEAQRHRQDDAEHVLGVGEEPLFAALQDGDDALAQAVHRAAPWVWWAARAICPGAVTTCRAPAEPATSMERASSTAPAAR